MPPFRSPAHVAVLVATGLAAAGCDSRSASAFATSPFATSARSELPAFYPLQTTDSTLVRAQRAIAEGRPYMATRLLAPLLSDARRTPEAVLLAAEAASAWEGHAETVALLAAEPWLATKFDARGHVLIAQSALSASPRAARTDSLAMQHARLALGTAARASLSAAETGRRATLLARAFDRLDALDSARHYYLRAAESLPEARDWLLLRAAGVTASENARAREYARLRDPVAVGRRSATEALALERLRDLAAAARAYEKAGEHAASFRLRLTVRPDSAARFAVRARMMEYLASPAVPASETRATMDLLELYFAPLPPADELTLARRMAAVLPAARLAGMYQRALAAGQGTERDRIALAELLLRLGRDADAARTFAAVPVSSPLAGTAAYGRARALLRIGGASRAMTALASVRRDFARDSAAAAPALYLHGDLAFDAGNTSEARRLWRELATSYPRASVARAGALRAALVSLVQGRHAEAARELEALAGPDAATGEAEAAAARYWAGQAQARAGNRDAARRHWESVMQREASDQSAGLSYYAMLAARALGRPAWMPDSGPAIARNQLSDAAHARASLLERLGFDVEARFEDDALANDSTMTAMELLGTARGFADRGQSSRAMTLARRALQKGASLSTNVLRLLYPVAQERVLLAESRARALDPALVAALIRQESNFTAHATSPAGARGLMQVMPPVGAAIAKSLGYPDWDAVLLYQPDVNLELGTRHLATALARYADPAFALAAYNAGDSRVRRWMSAAGATDRELFVERIPYVETRDYVRVILRSREVYRALYPWASPTPAARLR